MYSFIARKTDRKRELLRKNCFFPVKGGSGTGVLNLHWRGPFGKKTPIDQVEALGTGCEFGEYDR